MRESPKDPRTIDRTLIMLRLPRDKLGILMNPLAGEKFEIVGLVAELLSAPGIHERPARPPTVELSGESLSQVLWMQRLSSRQVTIRVCGKVANPDRRGCAEHIEETRTGVQRLRDLLLLNPVEQLGFLVGWDGSKFTKLQRIASPTTN